MILLDCKKEDFEEDLTPEQTNNMHLYALEQEAKNASVAKEYLKMKKKPFYHPEHFYEMSGCKFNIEKKRAIEPFRKSLVELTDAEYVLLLTKVLTYGSSYKYKHLNNDCPELAKKVVEQIFGSFEALEKDGLGYHVKFDEVFENAKEIMQLKDYFYPGEQNIPKIFF
ncbi:MAG: hypothetical protein J6X10_01240 [Bacteroidales bacterium]|nr:hypothetical protein [Bacteroidales bacterium]